MIKFIGYEPESYSVLYSVTGQLWLAHRFIQSGNQWIAKRVKNDYEQSIAISHRRNFVAAPISSDQFRNRDEMLLAASKLIETSRATFRAWDEYILTRNR